MMKLMESIKKNAWVWVGVVAVVLGGVFLAWRWMTGSMPSSGESSPVTPAFAPKGQLVPQFPKELVLDDHAVLLGSYSMNYNPNANQYTAGWSSSSSIDEVLKKYDAYFNANNQWTILGETKNIPGIRSVYAKNAAGAAVNVTIVKDGTGSKITVSYLGK